MGLTIAQHNHNTGTENVMPSRPADHVTVSTVAPIPATQRKPIVYCFSRFPPRQEVSLKLDLFLTFSMHQCDRKVTTPAV